MEYRTKPAPVEAIKVKEGCVINTNRKTQADFACEVPEFDTCDKGDWVVTTPNGLSRRWSDENFHKHYESY